MDSKSIETVFSIGPRTGVGRRHRSSRPLMAKEGKQGNPACHETGMNRWQWGGGGVVKVSVLSTAVRDDKRKVLKPWKDPY